MVIHGRTRRVLMTVLVLFIVGLFVREAVAQMIPTPDICKTTTPADWDWWSNGCWNYPTPYRGVVVR